MAETRPRWSRWLNGDNAAALLLALAALATAWSSYEASVWGGVQASRYTQSFVMRSKAMAASNEVDRHRMVDALMFTKWLEASVDRREALENYYELHFRPEFRPSFESWKANAPMRNLGATPFDDEAYRRATAGTVDVYDTAATRALEAGQRANSNSDHYVFVTVILASVLFFAGAVRPLVEPRLRGLMVIIAAILWVWALVRLVTAPVA